MSEDKMSEYIAVCSPPKQVDSSSKHVLLEPGTLVADRFVVGRLLGQGRFGSVYDCFDRYVPQRVALKVPIKGEEQFLLTEACNLSLAQELGVPYAPRLVDLTDHVLAMELIKGHPLLFYANRQPQSRRNILHRCRTYIAPVAHTLEVAAEHGLVHFDVKPENIIVQQAFFSPSGDVVQEGGLARLVDFGLALEESECREGMCMGSYDYIAPEVALNQKANCQADVYSLGVLTYLLTTGLFPRLIPEDLDDDQDLAPFFAQRIRPPHKMNPAVPKKLSLLTMESLQDAPEQRLPAREFRKELLRITSQ